MQSKAFPPGEWLTFPYRYAIIDGPFSSSAPSEENGFSGAVLGQSQALIQKKAVECA